MAIPKKVETATTKVKTATNRIIYGLAALAVVVVIAPRVLSASGGGLPPVAASQGAISVELPNDSPPLVSLGELGHEPNTTLDLWEPADGNWQPTTTQTPTTAHTTDNRAIPDAIEHATRECAHVLSPNCERRK